MDKRILELAVEALQERKAKVEAEIESIQAELGGRIRKPKIAVPRVVRRRRRTAAQRKAQSRRMKAYWAARKSRATTKPARKPTSAKPRRGPRSAAARKAQSERMKAYWAMKRREKQGKPAA